MTPVRGLLRAFFTRAVRKVGSFEIGNLSQHRVPQRRTLVLTGFI